MSSEQPTVSQLIRMMEFIGEFSFVIPSYNLPLPEKASGDNYRPEKVFRLLRSGMMTYVGSGGKMPEIHCGGIKLSQPWIDRAYIFLIKQVEAKINSKIKDSKMDRLPELLLRFNELDFLKYPMNSERC